MKSFQQFVEQAAAAAPAPTPSAPVQKTQRVQKSPKVTDPSTGVDKDKYGRWQGQAVNLGSITEPERTEVTPGKKGPDPDLPAGIANPNRKKDDEIASADWPKGRPGGPPVYAPWNKGWPSAPGDRPYQGPPGTPGGKYPMAKNGKGTQVAMQGGNPYQIRWPRDYFPGKKAPPGPGARPSGKPIGPARPPIA